MEKTSEFNSLLRSLSKEWKWLMQYVLQYRKEIIFYGFAGILGIVMGLGSTVASKFLIDAVVSNDHVAFSKSAALVIGFAFLQILMNAGISRLSSVVGTRINNEIRSSIYSHVVFSKWDEINTYHSGDLINRLEGDVSTISNSIVTFIPSVFTRVIQFTGCLGIVFYYDPTMAVLALLSAPFLFVSSKVSAKMTRKYNQESRFVNGQILSYMEESVQNLQTIKAFGITQRYLDQFKTLLTQYRSVSLAQNKFSVFMSTLMSIIGLFVSYACYGWSVWRLWNGAITFGTMTLFLQLSNKLTVSFSALISLAPSAISIATSAGRIMEVTELNTESDPDGDTVARLLPDARDLGVVVRAENVSFTYSDSETAVLNQVSFSAQPGETIAFVGPSGEGKTTILRLILGLLNADSGHVDMEVSGKGSFRVSDSTRRFCAYVPQGNAVFSGTIADNLKIVAPDATESELIDALKTAEAWDFITALPQGIHTTIGERGVNFSDGQIQRISIARAILRRAPVLIMDEATSALDTETERKVLQNLMRFDKKRTCIITSHRPSMLQYCNRIYRLHDDGSLTVDESK